MVSLAMISLYTRVPFLFYLWCLSNEQIYSVPNFILSLESTGLWLTKIPMSLWLPDRKSPVFIGSKHSHDERKRKRFYYIARLMIALRGINRLES